VFVLFLDLSLVSPSHSSAWPLRTCICKLWSRAALQRRKLMCAESARALSLSCPLALTRSVCLVQSFSRLLARSLARVLALCKQLLRIFGPNSWINSFIESQSAVLFFLGRQPRNFEIVTFVARLRKCFQVFWANFLLLTSLKKKTRRCFNTQEFIHVLSTGAVCHTLWRVLSNKVIWVLRHCWVHTPHVHAYTPLNETLCFSKAVCNPPSRSRRVTQILSIEALLFNSFG